MPPFLSELLQRERFVITTHVRGDGDAIGSLAALGLFLERVGKRVTLILPDAPAPSLEWLPGMDRALIADGSLEQLRIMAESDAAVVVDTNAASRIGKLGDSFRRHSGASFVVDHHPTPERWFDHEYVRESASSTGELVFELITAWEEQARADGRQADLIDADMATLLYVAIMTDTGSFRYSSVTPTVHRVVADLIERGGIVPDDIHARLYDTRSLTSLRTLARALGRIDTRYGGVVGYLALSRQFMTDAGAERGDTEGLANYVLSIEGVRVALFFLETDLGTKVSFRSRGDTAVNRWAAAFGGGGHKNAAGAFVKAGLDEVIERVLESAADFIDLAEAAESEMLGEADAMYYAELKNRDRLDS